jgi:hypothetical protein
MKIAFNKEWYDRAVYENKMRAPHMMTKYADTPARKAGRLRGLIIEHHVSGWFRENFPDNYREPDNYQKWTEKCAHDFKLAINGKTYKIDVSGPRKDGSFGNYSRKPKTGVDFHILAKPVGFASWDNVDYKKGFEIIGVVEPENFLTRIEEARIVHFENWLENIGLKK